MKYTFIILAALLVVAPGCQHKHTKSLTKLEQLEQDQAKYKTRGIALTATAPVAMVGGAVGVKVGLLACNAFSNHAGAIGFTVAAGILCGTGVYMLGQGIHDLAKAKKIKRMRMKEEAQARRLARQNAQLQ
jgi:hypothetical protein